MLFHGRVHPSTMGEEQIAAFLNHLATSGVSASTQNQALHALLSLYRHILKRDMGLVPGPWQPTNDDDLHTHVLNRGGLGVTSPADRL